MVELRSLDNINLLDKTDMTGMFHRHELSGLYQELIKIFHCKRCGTCCKETYPQLLKPEIKSIAKSQGLTVKKFKDQYTTIFEGKLTLKSPCPFYRDTICTIYSLRPNVCREYPIRFSMKAGISILLGINKCPLSGEINSKLNEVIIKFGNTIGRGDDKGIEPLNNNQYQCVVVNSFVIYILLSYLRKKESCTDEVFYEQLTKTINAKNKFEEMDTNKRKIYIKEARKIIDN